MSLYKPTELMQFLNSIEACPKRSLSQNFLIDGNIIRKIIQVSEVKEGDLVIEIGPGPGALTEALLGHRLHLIAIEKDEKLAQNLERLTREDSHLEIICSDILEVDLEKVLTKYIQQGKKAKVIANLPYHMTTPILAKLISMHLFFTSITLMVQEEVARRLVAKPKTKEYSSLSVFTHFHCVPEYAFRVSNRCFYPVPKVQSAVVILRPTPPPIGFDLQEGFFIMVRTAFNHRRKMLRASLRELYGAEAVTDALDKLGLPLQARPEELSLTNLLSLFSRLR